MTESKKQDRVLMDLLERDDGDALYDLSDIQPNRTWDYSLPTLTQPRRFTARNTYANDKAFMETLQKINAGFVYDVLSVVGALKEDNDVVLYGGALLDIILKRERHIHDFDLRLVGAKYTQSADECVKRAKEFVESIFKLLQSKNSAAKQEEKLKDQHDKTFNISEVIVARCQSTITVEIPLATHYNTETMSVVKFQFTFSPFASVPELLSHCFPHCTRIALSGNKIKVTGIAKYCIRSVCVVLDKKSLAAYHVVGKDHDDAQSDGKNGRELLVAMKRVIQYFSVKGFDIIMPDLDIGKVTKRNLKFRVAEVLDLPCLTVVFNSILHNKLMVQSLRVPRKQGQVDSGYDGYNPQSSFNVGTSIHHNIRCLVSDVYDKFQFVAQGEVHEHVFDFVPQVTPRMISKTYETIKEELTPHSIAVNKVISYFSATSPEDVIDTLVSTPLRKRARKSSHLPDPLVFNEDTMRGIIDKEVAVLEKKAQNMREKMLAIGGLDSIVVSRPEAVSTEDAIAKALYGEYGKA